MLRSGIVTVALGIIVSTASPGAVPIALKDLTVPPERLLNGCVLAATPSERISGNTFRGGLWARLTIPTNPWAGNDRRLIADIRERMDEPSPLPDGPPLTAGELARFRLKLADGIDEGYAGIYREGTPPELVTVYALQIGGSQSVDAVGKRRIQPDTKSIRLVIGRIVAVISGRGACFEPIADYVKSLTQ
jgi:hypothetical protein